MNAQLTEIMRLITSLIRTGTVTEVGRENWLCRVKVGELETNWINWLTLRAGGARTWWCPSLDEQVVVLSMGGNLETAFVLPAIYSNQFAPPSDSMDGGVTEYADGVWFDEYEPATGRWHVRGIKSMVIEAADNITFKTSELIVEADTTCINSEVVINGGVIDPGAPANGYVSVFAGNKWEPKEDHRGKTVWSTSDHTDLEIDYIGVIKDGFVTAAPATQYDKWDGSKWVTDTAANIRQRLPLLNSTRSGSLMRQ
ncbi:phage baseplate assembly protein V [Kosakonia arachidis]|uniref:Phage baseplate assembly protein V n=1 Tax=Kosakonia arachidis TaxID=551989 RepID=A0A1I7E546_9ENTR|nr:phage baseplate assembly protein V [Kosakonia arachidis]